jgi:hypothetical protein
MSFTHGKNTVVIFNGTDISAFSNNTDWEETADSHDVTCYGKNSHVFKGGLKTGKASLSGTYDDTATGPYDIVRPQVGNVVSLVYRPEGTGSGKPQETVNVLVTSYKQSAPVADMIKWTAEYTFSDDITMINQP